MEKTIENVKSNFNSIRTGRANPAILDKVEVESCLQFLVFLMENKMSQSLRLGVCVCICKYILDLMSFD